MALLRLREATTPQQHIKALMEVCPDVGGSGVRCSPDTSDRMRSFVEGALRWDAAARPPLVELI